MAALLTTPTSNGSPSKWQGEGAAAARDEGSVGSNSDTMLSVEQLIEVPTASSNARSSACTGSPQKSGVSTTGMVVSQARSLQDQLSTLSSHVSGQRGALAVVVRERDALSKQLSAAQAALHDKELEAAELRRQLHADVPAGRCATLEREAQELRGLVEQLEQQCAALVLDKTRLTAQVSQLGSQVALLRRDLQLESSWIDQLQEQLEDAQDDGLGSGGDAALRSRCCELERQLATVSARLEEACAVTEDLWQAEQSHRGVLAAWQSSAAQLEGRCAELQAELQAVAGYREELVRCRRALQRSASKSTALRRALLGLRLLLALAWAQAQAQAGAEGASHAAAPAAGVAGKGAEGTGASAALTSGVGAAEKGAEVAQLWRQGSSGGDVQMPLRCLMAALLCLQSALGNCRPPSFERVSEFGLGLETLCVSQSWDGSACTRDRSCPAENESLAGTASPASRPVAESPATAKVHSDKPVADLEPIVEEEARESPWQRLLEWMLAGVGAGAGIALVLGGAGLLASSVARTRIGIGQRSCHPTSRPTSRL